VGFHRPHRNNNKKKVNGRVEVYMSSLFIYEIDGNESLALQPGALPRWGRAPDGYLIGG
jgi:hypothetical protein